MIRAAREIPTNFSLVNVTVSPCLIVSMVFVTTGLGVPVTVVVDTTGVEPCTTVARAAVVCPFCPICTVSLIVVTRGGGVTVTVRAGNVTLWVTVLTGPFTLFVTVLVTARTAPGTVTVTLGCGTLTVTKRGTVTVTAGSVTHVTPGTQTASGVDGAAVLGIIKAKKVTTVSSNATTKALTFLLMLTVFIPSSLP